MVFHEIIFNAFDPNEIESITVLKTELLLLYMVHVRTTEFFWLLRNVVKKEKLSLTYNGTISSQSPTMYPELMNAYEYATNTNIALDNMGYDRNNPAHASRYYTEKEH